jgi:hypothetical protein
LFKEKNLSYALATCILNTVPTKLEQTIEYGALCLFFNFS